MKLTIIQMDIAWADRATNLKHVEEMIAAMPETDIVVLPEMFSTGFATEPQGIAEKDGGTLTFMKRQAREHNCAVAGSVATETEGTYRNRFYFVTPNGTTAYYDKHHLFTYGGENKHFTAGQERVTVDFRGVRVRLLVCYDLRFPVWCRNTDGYDLALFVASWPTSRVDAWDTLLKARAIENQCFVAGVNRIGNDPACAYCGSSAIIDAYGNVMASCGRDTARTVTTNIDLGQLAAFRKKFPVLNDADKL